MEKSRAKDAGRRKAVREKARALKDRKPRKSPASAVMKQAGRYRAIDTARKQLNEARQAIVPNQEQESYTATDKVETYAANAAHDVLRIPTHKAPTAQDRMRLEAVKEYQHAKAEPEKNTFHRETDYGETPTHKAPTAQERMRREAVKEYQHAKAEQGGNAYHRETNYGETPAPKATTAQERMRRETVKEYRRAKAELDRNTFHRETNYGETPTPKTPTAQERMRREAVKECQQAKTAQSENAFHRETDYGSISEPKPLPSKDRMRLEMVEKYSKGVAPTLRERMRRGIRKTHTLISSEQSATEVKENISTIEEGGGKPGLLQNLFDSKENVKPTKKLQGQRQTALPRVTSSGQSVKKKLVREQGRKAARNQAIKEIKTISVKTGSAFVKAFGAALTKALTPSSKTLLYGAGVLVLILIPFVVIMGVASILTSSGKGKDTYVPVSEDVEGYRPLIRQYAAEFGIPEYEDLIAAVMMQESGGQTSDPMQCSESGYNTEYPREPGGITDPEYSIKVGVQTLAEVLDMAGVESPVDLDGISLALQGYNYGSGYISWALSNYGGYSELNAIEYSDMMAEQYGWSGYGDKAYVSHVLRYYPIGRSFMSEGDAAIVAVAQTQIGNEGGLKYCEWYGYSYRVEWCAIFVSWCADQCGYLDAGILPKELNVIPYVEWFRERNQWQYMDYEPSPGDLIFYDWESDGLADHVGIVERVEDGVIYSIEGNAGDLCIENSHSLGAAPVYGFGLPAY